MVQIRGVGYTFVLRCDVLVNRWGNMGLQVEGEF